MTAVQLRRLVLPLMLGLSIPAAHAADAGALLARMNHAARSLDYEGVFVFQHGDQLESLRILHKAGNGGTRERLVSLNGAPREIIRTDREVRCYLPDENSVTVEQRRAERHNFPALLPDSLNTLGNNYRLKRGKDGRVAGRKVQSVQILPRDAFRYGYQLWADAASGLLLKASLLDEHGAVIEQYMFTQVAIGKPIAEADLKAQYPDKNIIWQRADDKAPLPSDGKWQATRLPAGFTLSLRMTRKAPAHRQTEEHLVYSDGLAVVSVFVEPVERSAKSSALSGQAQMGAVHAIGRVVDGHQVTVVGEVPAATVEMIGDSVAAQ